jgi:hypothetical protein
LVRAGSSSQEGRSSSHVYLDARRQSRAKIESSLKELKFGELKYLDADGKPIGQ